MRPNVFNFATSELSQDAMLCWLLAWAHPAAKSEDQKLHALGTDLIEAIFSKFRTAAPVIRKDISVRRQEGNIDVLALIDEKAVLCIEDKSGSVEHSDQLRRYRVYVEKHYPGREMLPVYVQTSDQSSYQDVRAAGYAVVHRRDLIDILNNYKNKKGSNAIALDFLEYLSNIERAIESYSWCQVSAWSESSLTGFYCRLSSDLEGAEWGYVNNPRGGFLGLWWGWSCVDDGSLYAQLEPNYVEYDGGYCVDALQLSFRIELNDSAECQGSRTRWHRRIVDAGRATGVAVTKPKRFGTGSTMTVAVLAEDPRRIDERGVLDYSATLEKIRAASELIATAADRAEQEHSADPR